MGIQINGNSVSKKTETWKKWSVRNKENVKIPNSRNRLENKPEVLVLSFSVLLNTLDRKKTSKRSVSGILGESNKFKFCDTFENTKSRKLSKTKPKVLELSFSLLLNSRNGENSQNDQIPEIWGILIKMQFRVALSPNTRKHQENQKSKRS